MSTAAGAPAGRPEPTFVQKLFEGTLVNETRCLTCETVSALDARLHLLICQGNR
jgi:hypothetical protein